MTIKKTGKNFSEQSERVSEAGKKGNCAVSGNLKKDAGRAVVAGHRSHDARHGSGEE